MKRGLTVLSVMLALNIVSYFYLTKPSAAQTIMPSLSAPILTNVDSTVRCLASGTTTVPASPVGAQQLVIQVDPNSGITGNILIQFTDDNSAKPSSITTSTAHYVLSQGDSITLTDERKAYQWDARHLFAVGPSGAVVRLLRVGYRANTTPQ